MKIVENALNKKTFHFLKNEIFSKNFPWYFSNTSYDVSADEKTLNVWSYSHTVLYDGMAKSNISLPLEMAFYEILDKANMPVEKILRIRIGCLTHKNSCIENIPHIDNPIPHKVGLLYMNVCDGDTKIYNKSYEADSNLSTYDFYKKYENNFLVEYNSEPVENKMILFDGLKYHSSSHPTNSYRRIAVNFNYI